MVIDKEEFKKMNLEQFKDHVLTIIEKNEKVEVYRFAKEDSNHYGLNIICYEHFVFITGDLGEWTFNCTWQTSLTNLPSQNESYFTEKLSYKCKKMVWDAWQCEADLNALFEQWKKELIEDTDSDTEDDSDESSEDDEDSEELESEEDKVDKLKEIFDNFQKDNEMEFIASVNDSINELKKLGFSDIWESGLYSCGFMLDTQLQCALIGLQLAKEKYKVIEVTQNICKSQVQETLNNIVDSTIIKNKVKIIELNKTQINLFESNEFFKKGLFYYQKEKLFIGFHGTSKVNSWNAFSSKEVMVDWLYKFKQHSKATRNYYLLAIIIGITSIISLILSAGLLSDNYILFGIISMIFTIGLFVLTFYCIFNRFPFYENELKELLNANEVVPEELDSELGCKIVLHEQKYFGKGYFFHNGKYIGLNHASFNDKSTLDFYEKDACINWLES